MVRYSLLNTGSEALSMSSPEKLSKILFVGHSWVNAIQKYPEQHDDITYDITFKSDIYGGIDFLLNNFEEIIKPEYTHILLFTLLEDAYIFTNLKPGDSEEYLVASPNSSFTASEYVKKLDVLSKKCSKLNPEAYLIVLIPPRLDLNYYNGLQLKNFPADVIELYKENFSEESLHSKCETQYSNICKVKYEHMWLRKIVFSLQLVCNAIPGHRRHTFKLFVSGKINTLGEKGYLEDGFHPSGSFLTQMWKKFESYKLLTSPVIDEPTTDPIETKVIDEPTTDPIETKVIDEPTTDPRETKVNPTNPTPNVRKGGPEKQNSQPNKQKKLERQPNHSQGFHKSRGRRALKSHGFDSLTSHDFDSRYSERRFDFPAAMPYPCEYGNHEEELWPSRHVIEGRERRHPGMSYAEPPYLRREPYRPRDIPPPDIMDIDPFDTFPGPPDIRVARERFRHEIPSELGIMVEKEVVRMMARLALMMEQRGYPYDYEQLRHFVLNAVEKHREIL